MINTKNKEIDYNQYYQWASVVSKITKRIAIEHGYVYKSRRNARFSHSSYITFHNKRNNKNCIIRISDHRPCRILGSKTFSIRYHTQDIEIRLRRFFRSLS